MNYTTSFNELRSVFGLEKSITEIPGSDISIFTARFKSKNPEYLFSSKEDFMMPENRSFSYPVFVPRDRKSDKVILLLHGLNERSWIKYLVWAHTLAQNTGRYVILFPIAFHINRSPESWHDPRQMMSQVKARTQWKNDISQSSFANIALSNRLTEDPLRFVQSGYVTISDILSLITSIRNGEHEFIPRTETIDIFSYSIGAFLSEILVMGNPEGLFTSTRLFIFCGGSVFSSMKGTSKLIMDSAAFDRIYDYYMKDFEESIKKKDNFTDLIKNSGIGMAFRSMIDFARFSLFREKNLERLHDQIYAVSLRNDTVIPGEAVAATLTIKGKTDRVEIWDFPYQYSHENPFPVFNSSQSGEVDYWFEKVLEKATVFFS